MSSDPPFQWSREVGDAYAPVRIIGKGGFASVWMAKKKKKSSAGDGDDYVAIKVMQDDGYSKREIDILSELTAKYTHPSIVRLLQVFKAAPNCSDPVNCVVLSLARGPTLTFVLNKGGALGLVVAQSISRQLIDAIAFLHGHAVIHRDVQPSNIIISGALINDDLWWSDDVDEDGKVLKMAKQCRITLVDFGFARALGPTDIEADIGLKKLKAESERKDEPEMEDAVLAIETRNANASCINEAFDDSYSSAKPRGRGRTRERESLDTSVSHQLVRDLSALGTRTYAAPEILAGIRKMADTLNDSIHLRSKTKVKTLGECVSSYGMDADAYSVGATIRHMVTGVSPDVDIEELIASKNHPVKKLVRSFRKRVVKKASQKRIKRYRLGEDLPGEVNDLVKILTHYNSRTRATVRSATEHPWIKSSSPGDKGKARGKGGPIVYLQCAE